MAVRDVVQAAAGQGGDKLYAEDVFSTYLYTGNNGSQTIENGVDLAGEGGMVWMKGRNATYNHGLMDTARGTSSVLCSNLADSAKPYTDITSFNSNGFTLGFYSGWFNSVGTTYASWSFRKAPKFFDVVTYTGDGVAGRQISHSLGSTPGCVILKKTSGTSDWYVYHRSLAQGVRLNGTDAIDGTYKPVSAVSDTNITLRTATDQNAIGSTYVAYLFAHDAGGFGDDGEQNVISCGSYTGVTYPNNTEINVGFEPQWVLIKNSSTTSGWTIWDVMRGAAVVPDANIAQAKLLEPNTAAAETDQPGIYPTATGFVVKNGLTSISANGDTMVYIAIRRPMKTPEAGTEVFSPIYSTASTGTALTTNFPVDMQFEGYPPGDSLNMSINDRLRGVSTNATQSTRILTTSSTAAEASPNATMTNFWDNTGIKMPGYYSGIGYISWNFRRAPGFFDVVCYSGTGSATAQTHNLGVVPELVIVRARNNTNNWQVYNAIDGAGSLLLLNTTQAAQGGTPVSSLTSTSLTFAYNANYLFDCSGIGVTYVAYLFASLPGVSKVGSYTGTGADLNVDCGFSAGARFILIKRTDAGGDWYVWDSVRGIVAGNDPYLLLNSTAAEVTSTDYIDPLSSGFTVTSSAPAALNASGGSYIFLAIA